MTALTKLFLLGHPRLEREQQALALPRRRAMALLAYLAATRRIHDRDTLVNLLYPDLESTTGRAELRRILSALKAVLSDDVLIIHRETVALGQGLWSDVKAFDEALKTDTTASLTEAIALYADGFMTGFSLPDSVAFDDWQFEQRESLRLHMIRALRRLVDHHSEQRDFETAITLARRWLAQDTYDENAYRTLMRLYIKANQMTAALRVYEECVRVVSSELQIQPESETTRLYEMIKANRGDTPAIGIMPPKPRLIVGRESVLSDLVTRLDLAVRSTPASVTLVQGWPGVGKSTTLAALAYDSHVEDLFPDGVLWTLLGATPNLLAELSLWAGALGIKPRESGGSVEVVATQIRSALHHRRMLLLVDDVWATSHAMLFQVGGPQCAVVISTRQNDIANALTALPEDVYKLPVLTEASSLELLYQLAPTVMQTHHDAALALIHDLEGLPLAIQVAGRLLSIESQAGWGIDELLAELRDGTKLLASQPPVDVAYPQSSPTITALLRKSTDLLTPPMRTRFIYLGMFAPKPATYDLHALAVAWGEHDPRPSVRVFIERGLIEPAKSGRFQMHALLAMHARSLVKN